MAKVLWMFKEERKIPFSLGNKEDFRGKIIFKLVIEEQTEYRLTEIGRRKEDISGREKDTNKDPIWGRS